MAAEITEGRVGPSLPSAPPHNTPLRKKLNGRGPPPRKPDEMETRLSGQRARRGLPTSSRGERPVRPRLSFGPDSAPMGMSHW